MPHCSSAQITRRRDPFWGLWGGLGSPGREPAPRPQPSRGVPGAGLPGLLPLAALGLLLAAAIGVMDAQRGRAEGAAAPPGHGGAAAASRLGEPLNPSSPEQRALAVQLSRQGAEFYGAWWCPACFQQRNLFGKEGSRLLPYVECDKTEADRERCTAAKIQAYPTWVLKGQRLVGVHQLDELKRWADEVGGSSAPASAIAEPKSLGSNTMGPGRMGN
jgi:hypothetical protein